MGKEVFIGGEEMETKTNQQIAMKVSWVSIVSNVLLSLFKLFAGIFGNSVAVVSDAVHSLSDVFSTFIVMIGIRMSNKAADTGHPYGHERFESVAAIILAVILALVGVGIGYSGVQSIITGEYQDMSVPGRLALTAAGLSILVKELMYRYTKTAAKKINSGALMADAWHHRSDALSSIGSLIGVLGSRIGFPVMDAVAAIVICFFIGKVAVSIFIDAVGKMTDRACDDSMVEEMKKIILAQEGVRGIDQIKTRQFGDRVYVDVEIRADGQETLSSTHHLAHQVHDAIEEGFENVKHCMVHVNPEE